jgi:dipeptidyl aminopeptidase/acylaminoacyl peptidase
MNKTLALIASIVFSVAVSAQDKKPLDHTVYNNWKDITNLRVSADGKFISWEIQPGQADGMLCVFSPASGKRDTLFRATQQFFTPDSKYLVARIKPTLASTRAAKVAKKKKEEMPADSLAVLNLYTGTVVKDGTIRSFHCATEGSSPWVVYHHSYKPAPSKDSSDENSGSDSLKIDKQFEKISKSFQLATLVALNPQTGQSFRFENVASYHLNEHGYRLSFVQMPPDSIPVSVVYSLDLVKGITSVIFENKGVVPSLTTSSDGGKTAFIHSSDTARINGFSLFTWKAGENAAVCVVDSLCEDLIPGWGISKNGSLWFSGDGNRLFTGTAPIIPVAEKDTLLAEEKPSVDVWNHKDPLLQPMQQKMADREKKRTFLAAWDFSAAKLFQLADTLIKEVTPMHKGNGNRFLGLAPDGYAPLIQWEGITYRDVYVIDVATRLKEIVLNKMSGTVALSPFGNYLLYYSPPDSAWFVYDIEDGVVRNLTGNIQVAFYDELNDMPQLPDSYGYAGFTANDEYVLLYDRYDIWRIDPEGKQLPENLTSGNGRKNSVAYRYAKTLEKEYFIDLDKPLYLNAFNENTMADGFSVLLPGKKPKLQELVSSAHAYTSLQRAENAEVFVFRKGNFREFPEIYTCRPDFKQPVKISETNPQSDEYLWGNAQLVAWTSSSGKELKGMLFTPENIPTNAQLPMLVYFYERSSETLHSHRIPAPSRSIINIPWCTSNGYVVFVPDIVYETGYPGESAYDAVISGTQAMIENFSFINPRKVGIQGQSWGGYQVAWLITRTDRFAAAMAGAPVSNMTSAYGGIRWATGMSRMFQYEKSQSRIGATLWEKPELYISNSPLFSAPAVNTPLLMMHNDNDGAVPWYQGIEFFTSLKRLGKPVWMLTYNNEEHNLTKWPNRVDLSIRMMQFFDHYLKDAPEPLWMSEGIPYLQKGKPGSYGLSN